MWFDAATGNLIGAIGGTLLGIIGGLWGAFAGISVSKGRRRGVVLHTGKAFPILGAVSLLFAAAALLNRQPYHVWYPALAVGAITTVCFAPLYVMVRRAYTRAELKKMSTEDLK